MASSKSNADKATAKWARQIKSLMEENDRLKIENAKALRVVNAQRAVPQPLGEITSIDESDENEGATTAFQKPPAGSTYENESHTSGMTGQESRPVQSVQEVSQSGVNSGMPIVSKNLGLHPKASAHTADPTPKVQGGLGGQSFALAIPYDSNFVLAMLPGG